MKPTFVEQIDALVDTLMNYIEIDCNLSVPVEAEDDLYTAANKIIRAKFGADDAEG